MDSSPQISCDSKTAMTFLVFLNKETFNYLVSAFVFGQRVRGSCEVFVHRGEERRGDNPNSMDGVNDLCDHNSFNYFNL